MKASLMVTTMTLCLGLLAGQSAMAELNDEQIQICTEEFFENNVGSQARFEKIAQQATEIFAEAALEKIDAATSAKMKSSSNCTEAGVVYLNAVNQVEQAILKTNKQLGAHYKAFGVSEAAAKRSELMQERCLKMMSEAQTDELEKKFGPTEQRLKDVLSENLIEGVRKNVVDSYGAITRTKDCRSNIENVMNRTDRLVEILESFVNNAAQ